MKSIPRDAVSHRRPLTESVKSLTSFLNDLTLDIQRLPKDHVAALRLAVWTTAKTGAKPTWHTDTHRWSMQCPVNADHQLSVRPTLRGLQVGCGGWDRFPLCQLTDVLAAVQKSYQQLYAGLGPHRGFDSDWEPFTDRYFALTDQQMDEWWSGWSR